MKKTKSTTPIMVEIPIIGTNLKPFRIGMHPVTNLQYNYYLGVTRGNTKPVTSLILAEVTGYLAWLSETTKTNCRLPTDAEWMHATGGFPNNPFDYGWFKENSGEKIHKVGKKKPNAFGLYDMWGNVWEELLVIEPELRVFRGGSCKFNAQDSRFADRNWNSTTYRIYNNGFRVVSSI